MTANSESPSVSETRKCVLRVLVALVIAGVAQGLSAASGEAGEPTRFTFTEYHMGIDARLVLYATSKEQAQSAAEAAYKRIADLEAIMSDYRADSELMKLCARAGDGPVKVSPDLFRVLDQAQSISARTDGAFDVTIGPLVQIWRRVRREAKMPPQEEIARAMSVVGWEKMILNREQGTVSLISAGMRLDLGGIAKGYASDEALKVLKAKGVRSALIEMGGDIALSDAPPKSKGWKVSVPNFGNKIFELSNCAISSSGDTEQYVEIDGIRYSHVVDPKTGKGLSSRVQATVIASEAFISDPVSTALTILEPGRRDALLRHYPGMRTFIKVAR